MDYSISMNLGSALVKGAVFLAVAFMVLRILKHPHPAESNFLLRLALSMSLILPGAALLLSSLNLIVPAPVGSVWQTIFPTHGVVSYPGPVTPGMNTSVADWLAAIWLTGFILVSGRVIFGIVMVSRLVRRAQPPVNCNLQEKADTLAAAFGIGRPVRPAVSPEAKSPFVFGFLWPVVILPQTTLAWPETELKMILLHELAHIRRQDLLWAYIGYLATAVYWFNPLVWIMRRQMITESDKTCDARVVAGGIDPHRYARRLIDLARGLRGSRPGLEMGVGMALKSQLEERIMSILRKPAGSIGINRSIKTAVILLVITILPLAAVQLKADETEPDQKPNAEASGENLPSPDEFIPVTTMPEMIVTETPVYPPEAKKEGREGKVYVKALVDKTGRVRKAFTDKSSGYDYFDKAAVEAAYACRYKPAEQDGKKVAVWIAYSVTFALDDKDDPSGKE